MSEPDEWVEVAEASDYGAWRREQHFARMQANADTMAEMLSGGGQADHQADHDHLTRSKHGMFGGMTGPEMAAIKAEKAATVGTDWGQERVVERLGGVLDHGNDAPAPHRVDLRHVNDRPGYQQDGESPVMRYLRGER